MVMQRTKICIIVTSAGTASAISVIKSLKQQVEFDIRIVAVDSDPLAAGLYFADKHYVVPKANESDYIETLINIGKEEHATILIPIYSKEISKIASNKDLFEKSGLKTLLPHSNVVELCNNKMAMNSLMQELGINIPKTYTVNDLHGLSEKDFPLFLRPNTGSSSVNTFIINNKEEILEDYKLDKFVIQEFIDAAEITIDVFCNKKHEAIVVSPRLRLAVKNGQSTKGKTISNELFLPIVNRICKKVEMVGCCNIQFFYKEGKLIFIELNPRYAAGGLMLTVSAGANIPLLVVKEILDVPFNKEEYDIKIGTVMTRYWEEIILNPE
jgi:carbamoyl-phosphate synthase large subunit